MYVSQRLHHYFARVGPTHRPQGVPTPLIDSYEPRGPFSAKEIGEGSTLPVLGAVAHAIANATGVWIKELPITAEKLLSAIRKKESGESSAIV